MTAIKMIHSLFPSALSRDSQRSKRRKSQSSPCSGMDFDGDEQHQHRQNSIDKFASTPPSVIISRALADHGLPDRLDPLSMDYLMDFDYDDGSLHRHIPTDVLMAIQYGNADQFIQHYKSKDQLLAERNSQGETLLHLACRWGSVSIVKLLLRDVKVSTLVLDRQGRSPLHSLCFAMNSRNVNGTVNFQNCNHLETMQLLIQEKSTLILYKDKQGKTPLEYIQQSNNWNTNDVLLYRFVNEMLRSERIVERVVEEMSHRMENSRSGQRMTIWEKIDNMIDLSALDSAIMETGFSI